MKRLLIVIISGIITIAVILGILYGVMFVRENRVLLSIGWYKEKNFWTHGWRDYTDFGVYHCPNAKLKWNIYFDQVTGDDIERIDEYLDNYERWIESFDPEDELVRNYTFSRDIIDELDYFYINSKDENFSSYDLWIYDSQTKILYYFHNND